MIFMIWATVPERHGGGNVCPAARPGVLRPPLSRRRDLRAPFFLPRGGADRADSLRPPVYSACLFRYPPNKLCLALLFLLSLLPPRSVPARTGAAPPAAPQTSAGEDRTRSPPH